MLIKLERVLNAEEISVANDLIRQGSFVDGKLSAGSEAVRVKANEELSSDEKTITPLNNLVMGKLIKHPTYLSAAFAKGIATPIYARYTEGMMYGNHIDDPIMGQANQRYRSDISITIFLNEPDDYEGGELEIQTTFGPQTAKLAAGDAIMYPSSSTHRVCEITRGERIVAVTWLQSMIKDPSKRELLYNLSIARDGLLEKYPNTEETELISNSYANLVRMWSEL